MLFRFQHCRLLAQEKPYRDRIVSELKEFPALLCNLEGYPERTVSAMLFALQSIVLSSQGKQTVIQNTKGILQSLLNLSRGLVRPICVSHR